MGFLGMMIMKKSGYGCGNPEKVQWSASGKTLPEAENKYREIVKNTPELQSGMKCSAEYEGLSVPKIGGIVGGFALLTFGIIKAVKK